MNEKLLDVLVGIMLAAPGLIALRSVIKLNNSKSEHEEKDKERIASTVASQLTDAAGDLVTQYKQHADDISEELSHVRNELKEYKELVKRQNEDYERRVREWDGKINAMQRTINALRERLKEYRKGVIILTEQIRKLGETPRYTPPVDSEID